MKNIFKILFLLITIIFTSCDYENDPYQPTSPSSGSSTAIKKKKILLEDYTGHTCGTCPPAAAEAARLKGIYQDQLVVMAVHAGPYAPPSTGVYTYDFRTTTGTDYYNTFGFPGTPNGLVNRAGYSTSHIKSYSSWEAYIDTLSKQSPDIYIDITNSYDTLTRQLTTTVNSEFINAMTGTYKLIVLLTEDSIIKPQKNYLATPIDVVSYVHRHALRDAINSTWGDIIATGTTAPEIVKNNIYTYTINAAWNDKQCSVVAFVYDASNYEVIQAEEKHVR